MPAPALCLGPGPRLSDIEVMFPLIEDITKAVRAVFVIDPAGVIRTIRTGASTQMTSLANDAVREDRSTDHHVERSGQASDGGTDGGAGR